jgi:hypothetical protein
MSYSKITIDFGDGTHDFQLRIGELRELKDKTGAGPMELYQRIVNQKWYVDDCREILRLGLIGGGAKPLDALDLVRRYVEARPLFESISPALTVLVAAIFGPEDEAVPGKEQAPAAPEMTSPSGASTDRVS